MNQDIMRSAERSGGTETFSVAMCTYNGAPWLREQLESIAAQTRLPDEMVVCDDGSCDGTMEMLEAFAATAQFPVRVIQNEARLGSTGNFAKCAALCEGSVIVLSDQDDWWYPSRLQMTEEGFRAHPDASLVFFDADLVDPVMKPLGVGLWKSLRFTGRMQEMLREGRGFELLLRRNLVTGATAAFRADLLPLILPIPEGSVHDEWIALVGAAVSRIVPLPAVVIRYRQHPQQQIGAGRESAAEKYRRALRLGISQYPKDLRRFQTLLARLSHAGVLRQGSQELRRVTRKVEFCSRRLELAQGSRWNAVRFAVAFLAGRYRRYASGWRAAARDIVLILTR